MAQGAGYTLASIGPAGLGALHDLSGDWIVPLWALVAVTCVTWLFGLGGARDRLVA
jgi:CP family cyanate transporter-like MFS transporter